MLRDCPDGVVMLQRPLGQRCDSIDIAEQVQFGAKVIAIAGHGNAAPVAGFNEETQ
jgi:hypothetical protein